MLSVSYDGVRYVAKLSFEKRDLVARAGFEWNEERKHWFTYDARRALRLWEHLDTPTKQHVEEVLGITNAATGAPRWPTSKSPFLHQLEGATHCLTRRSSYLAFDPGLGKTATVALAYNAEPGKMIVVVPSFLRFTWRSELLAWLTVPASIQMIDTQRSEPDEWTDIYIVSDSVLHCHELREKFFKLPFDFTWIVTDEAHRYSNEEAKRTKSLLGAKRVRVGSVFVQWKGFHHKAKRIVDLSGTPMRNRPMELWPLAYHHAPHAVNYYHKHPFGMKYCAGFQSEWGMDYSGHSNEEELGTSLRRHWMLVRHKEDCIDLPKKLPPQFIFLNDKDQSSKIRTLEMQALHEHSLDKLIRVAAETHPHFKEKFETRQSDAVFQFISDLRKLSGVAKVTPLAKLIPELMEVEGPLVVFAWHDEVIKKLADRLSSYKPIVVTGQTPGKMRKHYEEMFQKGSTDLFLANILAAGIGFTLTRASCVLVAEPSWVPADNDQAIDRVHRIGQEWEVKSYFALWENSLDHRMLNAHQDKTAVAKAVIG